MDDHNTSIILEYITDSFSRTFNNLVYNVTKLTEIQLLNSVSLILTSLRVKV